MPLLPLKPIIKLILSKLGLIKLSPNKKIYPTGLVEHFRILHAPDKFFRRTSDFTANICGIYGKKTEFIQYRINNSDWKPVHHYRPRVPEELFTIELSPDQLNIGDNHLVLDVQQNNSRDKVDIRFVYEDASPHFPLVKTWEDDDLDVSDGSWEVVRADNQNKVRVTPGFEDYDRILIISSAFTEGRRIETDIAFHQSNDLGLPFGFGVLPLWGGRPDAPGISPRRGWNFSLAWFYSHYNAVGMEFSYKHGDDEPDWLALYKNFDVTPGETYKIIIEVQSIGDNNYRHQRYQQRLKWFRNDTSEPDSWMMISDAYGCPIPYGHYGIGLISHRCSVDFGKVTVNTLPDISS